MEKILNSEIGLAVGVAVHEYDEMKDPEVQDFRRNIMQVCKECVELRDLGGLETQALFAYPADVESKSGLPESVEKKLDRGEIILCIWQLAKDGLVAILIDFYQKWNEIIFFMRYLYLQSWPAETDRSCLERRFHRNCSGWSDCQEE